MVLSDKLGFKCQQCALKTSTKMFKSIDSQGEKVSEGWSYVALQVQDGAFSANCSQYISRIMNITLIRPKGQGE